MDYFIGIDIGTTHTKAVIATAGGKLIQEIKKSYPSYQPLPGYHEQDPEEIFTSVWEILQQAVEAVADKEKIIAITFSAAMHSLMAVGAAGKPLTPLLTWADTRSNRLAGQLKNTPEGESIYRHTGTPVHPMSPLCKIAWLREEAPDIFARAAKFISGKEYVWHQLFGEFVTDHSIASATGLFDIFTKDYHPEALAFAGITKEQLSKPVPVNYRQHMLRGDYQIPGLSKHTAFIIGASDGCLANIGSGAVATGEAALTIGTSGAVRIIKNQPLADSQHRLFNYVADDTHFLAGGAINNGGIVLKWFIDTFHTGALLLEKGMNELIDQAAAVPPGSDGLIFLPYVYGERAPVWDATAKGVFFGIQPHHTRPHFLRAVLEGVAFSLLQIMEALEENGEKINTVYASGGFTESPAWLAIVAGVLQKKMKLNRVADASAMGAVYLGMQATGRIKDWKEVKTFLPAEEEWLPDPALEPVYRENYKIYSGLYDKLKKDF